MPYRKPRSSVRPFALEAEVVVQRRAAAAGSEGGAVSGHEPAAQPRAGGGSLLRRLRRSREAESFDADGYSAYRSGIEEASVTIVRREQAAGQANNLANKPIALPQPPEDRPATVSRFLDALIGKAK